MSATTHGPAPRPTSGPHLTDLLLDDATAPPAEIVYTDDAVVTRAELVASCRELAAVLTELGVQPGDPVAGILPTSPEAIAAMFGTWIAGGVYVPMNARLASDEIMRIVGETRPVGVIGTPAVLDTHADVLDDVTTVATASLTWTARRRVTRPDGAGGLDADVAMLLYTSGTTGRPKPVMIRHGGTVEAVDAALGAITKKARDRTRPAMPNIVPLSMSLWAAIYNVCFAFRAGAPVILMEKFRPRAFAAAVKRFEIRSSVLAPAMMAMLLDDPEVTDLAPLRFVRSIAAPLSPHQARRFHDRFGIAVLNSYGQTELGGEVIGWNAADAREFAATKLGAIGRPHNGVDIRFQIGDEPVGIGAEGELCIRSPYMSAGYLGRDHDLAARLTPDGYLRTGDLGHVDADGFVWLEGRVSDMINRGGLKVFPADVEEVIRRHPAVRDVAVVGAPDERLGEVPWAFVVVEPGAPTGDALGRELEAVCRERLVAYKVPVAFSAVDALPRNDMGKVVRRTLVDRITAGAVRA